jgi:hypothetical protein
VHQNHTRRIATFILCALTCWSSACTTLQPLAVDPTGERTRAVLKPGDTVRVVMTDGTVHGLKVTSVGESALSGDASKLAGAVDAPGSHLELRYRDMKELDVQRINGLKTTGIVAAVVVVAVIAIASGGGSHEAFYGSR